jgi:hypothetical protein
VTLSKNLGSSISIEYAITRRDAGGFVPIARAEIEGNRRPDLLGFFIKSHSSPREQETQSILRFLFFFIALAGLADAASPGMSPAPERWAPPSLALVACAGTLLLRRRARKAHGALPGLNEPHRSRLLNQLNVVLDVHRGGQ